MNLKKIDVAINNAEIKSNLPYHLIRVGLACNVNCFFCNIPVESNIYPAHLSFNEIKEEIDKIFKKDPHPKISITGGEPTIRADLIKIIEYLKKKKTKIIELQTNGILLADKKKVIELKRAGLDKAFVSLHSHLPRLHDLLIRENGGFEKCVRGIKNLIKNDILVTLNPVITSLTYKHLPDYIKFVHFNLPKVSSISLSVVQPHGRAMINKKIVPRYSLISPYIKKSLDIADRLSIVVHNPYCGLPLCIGEWYKRLDRCLEYSVNALGGSDNSGDKIKLSICKECDLDRFCNGIWRAYLKLDKSPHLSPVKNCAS